MAGVLQRSSGRFACEMISGRMSSLLGRLHVHLRILPTSHLSTTSSPAPAKPTKTNNLLNQYMEIKKRYPDFIVLFQVGDFYEIYGKDAIKVSEKMSLRLTRSATVSKLMAGFPVRSLSSWLTPLVQHGFQLAISTQLPEKTAKSAKIIHRDVVRLVTPGTLLEPLEPDANYLLSITRGPGSSLGMAWLDVSTGEFNLATSMVDSLEEDLARINPAEILMAEKDLEELDTYQSNYKMPRKLAKSPLRCVQDFHLTKIPEDWFEMSSATDEDNFKEAAPINMSQFSSIELSAGAALEKFVQYTQRDVTPILNLPTQYTKHRHMAIDSNTRRALEVTKPLMNTDQKATLFGVMNNTCTHLGRRLLYARLCAPSTEISVIQSRLEAVEFFYRNRHIAEEVRQYLKQCSDVERNLQKVATSMTGLADLRRIRDSIVLYSKIRDLLLPDHVTKWSALIGSLSVDDYEALVCLRQELDQAVGQLPSDASVMEGYSDVADEIRATIEHNEQQVRNLREEYRSLLDIPKLVINTHRVFIRVVEIPATKESALAGREDFVRVDRISGKVRYSTLRLQELNAELKSLQDHNERIQKSLSEELCQQVISRAIQIKHLAKSIAEIDVASSLALLAITRGYTKPDMVEGTQFRVSGGRHPVVDILRPDSFVCNDCDLSEKNVWIVTGPNMGGKSTFLRQNALIAILAQVGSYVPAQQATIGIIDRLFARIGASDSLVQHQSTFMCEMLETAYILANATENSLVVIDEIGRGTSTLDGLSIAWAVTEYLHNVIRCRTLASTHFHQLARLAEYLRRVDCYHVTAQHVDDGITFTFKVMHGADHESFGIDVARLAGIPEAVEARAREILSPTENSTEANDPEEHENSSSGATTKQVDVNIHEELRKELKVFGNNGALVNQIRNDTELDKSSASKQIKYHVFMGDKSIDDTSHSTHSIHGTDEPKHVVEFVQSKVTSSITVIHPNSLTPRQAKDIISQHNRTEEA